MAETATVSVRAAHHPGQVLGLADRTSTGWALLGVATCLLGADALCSPLACVVSPQWNVSSALAGSLSGTCPTSRRSTSIEVMRTGQGPGQGLPDAPAPAEPAQPRGRKTRGPRFPAPPGGSASSPHPGSWSRA